MSLNAYLTLKGKKQGAINGGVIQKGREKTIAVYAYNHEIISPRDAASGLPTGKRQHRPLRITKEIDKSTPLLFNALVNNEILSEFVLKFYAPHASGVETQIYTITLTNANISSIMQDKLESFSSIPLVLFIVLKSRQNNHSALSTAANAFVFCISKSSTCLQPGIQLKKPAQLVGEITVTV